ncbi:MAG: hypothetical protein FWC97_11025 [Treponema sp.]|nr:hypothetical protein [Treponema sp.]
MKIYYLILIVFILISCTRRSENNLSSDEQLQSPVYELSEPVLDLESLLDMPKQENILFINFNQIQNVHRATWNIGGLVYRIRLQNEVNVHRWPLLESRTISTLRSNTVVEIVGVTENNAIFDGQEDYWVGITWGENSHGPQNYGWVLSSFLKLEGVFLTNLIINSSSINAQGNLVLNARHTINGIEREFYILPNKQEGYNNFTFFWDYRNENFHYSNRPGLYVWNEDTKELKHLSYIISDGFLNVPHIVTSGFRYLIKYLEQENWVGDIFVWNLNNGEIILRSRFHGPFELNGYVVKIAKYYDYFSYSSGWQNHEGDDNWIFRNPLSDEEKAFARNFLETNDIPAEYLENIRQNPSVGVVLFFILVEHNIDTNEGKIVGGVYIHGQF